MVVPSTGKDSSILVKNAAIVIFKVKNREVGGITLSNFSKERSLGPLEAGRMRGSDWHPEESETFRNNSYQD